MPGVNEISFATRRSPNGENRQGHGPIHSTPDSPARAPARERSDERQPAADPPGPEDYQDGARALVIRVTREPTPTDDPEWFDLRGFEIAWNGDGSPSGRSGYEPARYVINAGKEVHGE